MEIKNLNNVDVSIIIVSWNTKKLLENCLNSIYKETVKYTFEIIVIDNNSPDGSADMVYKQFPEVILIANKTNNGFAPANNQGIKIAKGKNILLLNPDTVVINNAIDHMLDYIYQHKNENIGIVTCKLLNDDLTLQKSVNNFFNIWKSFFENRFFADIFSKLNTKSSFMSFWDHGDTREIDWAFGAVLLYTREVADKVGMLDDRFWIYAEEMDFYIRVKKAGFKSIFLHNVEIIHYGKSSSRQRRAEMFIQNYKSFYLFLKKHYSYSVYLTYRIRTYFYMILWITKFSITYLVHLITGKSTEEDKNQIDIYFKTLLWHFNKDSFIKL